MESGTETQWGTPISHSLAPSTPYDARHALAGPVPYNDQDGQSYRELTAEPDEYVTEREWKDYLLGLEDELQKAAHHLEHHPVQHHPDGGTAAQPTAEEGAASITPRATQAGATPSSEPTQQAAQAAQSPAAASPGSSPSPAAAEARTGRLVKARRATPTQGTALQSLAELRQQFAGNAKMQARGIRSIYSVARNSQTLLARISTQHTEEQRELKTLVKSMKDANDWASQVEALKSELEACKHARDSHLTTVVSLSTRLTATENDLRFVRDTAASQMMEDKDLYDVVYAECEEANRQFGRLQLENARLRQQIATLQASRPTLQPEPHPMLHAHLSDSAEPATRAPTALLAVRRAGDGPCLTTGEVGSCLQPTLSSQGGSVSGEVCPADLTPIRELHTKDSVGSEGGTARTTTKSNNRPSAGSLAGTHSLGGSLIRRPEDPKTEENQLKIADAHIRRLEDRNHQLETDVKALQAALDAVNAPPVVGRNVGSADGTTGPLSSSSSFNPHASFRRVGTQPVSRRVSLERRVEGESQSSPRPGVAQESAAGVAQRVHTLQAELAVDQAQLQATLAELTKTQAQLETGRVELAALQSQLATERAGLAEVQTQLADGKAELGAVTSQLATEQTSLHAVQTKLADGKAELDAVQSQLATEQASLGAVQTKLADGNTELGAVQSQLATAQTSLSALQAQLADGKTKLAAVKTQLIAKEAELEKTQTQLVAEQAMLQVVQERLAADENKLDTTRSQLAADQAKQATLHTQLTDEQAQLAAIQTQLAAAQRELSLAHTKLHEAEQAQQAGRQLQQQAAAEQQQHLAEAQQVVREQESEIARLKDELNRDREQHDEVLNELSQASRRVADHKRRCDELQREVQQLRATAALDLEEAQQAAAQAEQDVTDAQDEARRLSAEVQRLEREIKDLQAARAAAEAEAARAKASQQQSSRSQSATTPSTSPRKAAAAAAAAKSKLTTSLATASTSAAQPDLSSPPSASDNSHTGPLQQQLLLAESQVQALQGELEAVRERLHVFVDAAQEAAQQQQQEQQQQQGTRPGDTAWSPSSSTALLPLLGLMRDTEVLYGDQQADRPSVARIRLMQGQMESLLLAMVDKDAPRGTLLSAIRSASTTLNLPSAPIPTSGPHSHEQAATPHGTGDPADPNGRPDMPLQPGVHEHPYYAQPLSGEPSSMDWSLLPGDPALATGGSGGGQAAGGHSEPLSWASGVGEHQSQGGWLGGAVRSGGTGAAGATDDLLGDLDGLAWELPEPEPPPSFFNFS